MPLMSLRLARPTVVIDINRIVGLNFIATGPSESLVIGALTRQRAVERSVLVRKCSPLLAAGIPLIAHSQIRNRGTIGGSLVHAHPAAELPAICMALGAELVLKSVGKERAIAADDFFLDYMSTAIEAEELLTEIRIPDWKMGTGWAIEEIARRQGDFAIAGVTVILQVDESDNCRECNIVLFGVNEKPIRASKVESALRGIKLEQKMLQDVAGIISKELDPFSDIHASAEYRREVAGVLTRRALEAALTTAVEQRRL